MIAVRHMDCFLHSWPGVQNGRRSSASGDIHISKLFATPMLHISGLFAIPMLHISRLFCNIRGAILPASAMPAVRYHINARNCLPFRLPSCCYARADIHLIKHTLSVHLHFAPVVGLHSAVPLLDSVAHMLLCRPALHIYNWAHTALRGLVTVEQTLNTSLHEYIAAFRQKDAAAVSNRSCFDVCIPSSASACVACRHSSPVSMYSH